MITRSHGHLLVLGGKCLCPKLLYDVLVGLLENRKILEGEIAKVIRLGRLAETPALQVPNMGRYMQGHKTSFDRIDLRPYSRKRVVGPIGVVGSSRGGRWRVLVLDFLCEGLKGGTSRIEVFRVLRILGLGYELSLIVEQRVPVDGLEAGMIPDLFASRRKLALFVSTEPLIRIHAKQPVDEIFGLIRDRLTFLVIGPSDLASKNIFKDKLGFSVVEWRISVQKLEHDAPN